MAAAEFIEMQAAMYGDLEDRYLELRNLYNRKLWHQLTEVLLAFTSDPATDKGQNLIELYENFINKLGRKLNQLELAQIVISVSKQYYPSSPPVAAELEAGIAFLTTAKEKRSDIGEAAWVVLSLEAAALHLKAGQAGLAAGKAALEEAEAAAGGMAAPPALVSATLHRVSAEYYKMVGPAESFFTNAVQFLSHTDVPSMPPAAAAAWASDLALAALVGNNVFNFGEIVEHPILAALEGTPDAWLGDLLGAFQTGDIDAFNALVAENAAAFGGNPALQAGQGVMKEKLTLLCVMELVSNLPSAARNVPFTTIAEATRLGLEQVEWLIMRGMSLGLIKGSMDQVAGTFTVTYVKPRVLHTGQLSAMKAKVEGWADKVKTTLVSVEDSTGELFT